jgi:hypothetical protein
MTTERDQLYADLFTTALEGGIGYWSTCSNYRWTKDDGTPDVTGFEAVIIEDEEYEHHGINRSTISRGYRLATGEWRDRLRWSTEPPPRFITEEVDWDYDAGDADMIVQLGLFGEVVYG